MRKSALLALFLCLTLAGFSATRKSRRSASRKQPSATAARKAGAAGKVARKKAGTKSVRSGKASASKGRARHVRSARAKKKAVPAWRRGQQAPTPERYKEIQQALAERGYLQGSPTGVWGSDSVDALKRFQQDQDLEPTGKLDALSLITLGLGPRRESNASGAGNGGSARLLGSSSDQSAGTQP